MRTASVFTPRRVSHASNGLGTEPTAFWVNSSCSASASSEVISAPPTTSEWPPMYLVVECSTTSAPSASGDCRYGEANVLSTTQPGLGLAGDVGHRGDVGDAQQRVGGRLAPDHPGLGAQRRPQRGHVGEVDRGVLDAPRPEHLVDQPERAAVRVVRDHDVVARRQQHAQQDVGGAHPRPERDGVPPAFQRGEALLQRGAGGVGATRVLVARPGAAHAVLRVRGRRVDREDHRAGGRVGCLARVDRLGRKAVHGTNATRCRGSRRAHPTGSPRPRACRRPAPARRRPRRTRSSPCRAPRSPRWSAAAATCAW